MSVMALFALALFITSVSAIHDGGTGTRTEVGKGGKSNLEPAEVIQHVLEKGSEFVETHIEWIVDFSHDKIHQTVDSSPSIAIPSSIVQDDRRSRITSSPSLCNRAALPDPQIPSALCDCNSQVNAAKSTDAKQLSGTVAQLQSQSAAAVSAASSSLLSVQTSASSALQVATQSLMAATSASSAAVASASAAVASASSAVASASTSVSAAVASATSSASKS